LTAGGGTTGIPAAQFWHQDFSDAVLGGVKDSAEAFDHFGAALAAGDFNGDDFSDLAIGVPDEPGADYTGAVHVLFGTADGLTASAARIDDQLWTYNNADFPHDMDAGTDTQFGAALVWGDFDGDTVGDLAVGMPGATGRCRVLPPGCTADAGRVVILYGSSPDGLGTAGHQVLAQGFPTGGNFIDVGDTNDEANDRFGSVLAAGNFDNDRFDDLVIGVPREDLEQFLAPTLTNAGMVHVAYGSANGISSRIAIFNQRIAQSAGVSDAPEAGNQLGRALAVGDFDGNGFDDLAIGTPFEDVGGASNAGTVYVLYSEATIGLRPLTAEKWTQATSEIVETSDHFGKALTAGDFNADGRSDLAIGVPDENLPDSNGISQADAGGVNIIYGSSSGLTDSGDQFFSQGNLGAGRTIEAGDQFGASLTAWNFGRNQGGFPLPILRSADLAIGAPGEDLSNAPGVNLADAGAVSVLYGHVINKLSATGNQFWHQNVVPGVATPPLNEAGDQMEASDRFGAALY
jgi:hypothetical protein